MKIDHTKLSDPAALTYGDLEYEEVIGDCEGCHFYAVIRPFGVIEQAPGRTFLFDLNCCVVLDMSSTELISPMKRVSGKFVVTRLGE